jgi:hypothetical protein
MPNTDLSPLKLQERIYFRVCAATERLLKLYGENFVVFLITAILIILSEIFSCIVVNQFQGYIDALTIGVSFSAPALLVPLPAKIVLSMFVRLKKTEEELLLNNIALENSLSQIKTLSGLIPICCSCKKIRDDQGYWNEIEEYINEHADIQLSHGICPECTGKLYPDLFPEMQHTHH